MTTPPRHGDAVHFVEHHGLQCTTGLVAGTTHPYAGDDGQWCLSMDTFIGGSAAMRRSHVPHGDESGHWHSMADCPRGKR